MTARRRSQRGVTIVELLVALLILAVIGGAVLKLIVRQASSMESQEAWRTATWRRARTPTSLRA